MSLIIFNFTKSYLGSFLFGPLMLWGILRGTLCCGGILKALLAAQFLLYFYWFDFMILWWFYRYLFHWFDFMISWWFHGYLFYRFHDLIMIWWLSILLIWFHDLMMISWLSIPLFWFHDLMMVSWLSILLISRSHNNLVVIYSTLKKQCCVKANIVNLNQELWKTVQTQMKCSIMLY